ncbi:hypothetical protein GALMADRAFT_232813 [Galerina marginata CBS 339.88]|uniref:Carbohydrate esterase family 16 protein n=1 Tax=Galerina marginata (strain CBS 339.88) TaxID=685588 RepID=A0A067S579_GALM3|nr:hypothetical protein GALMADRAFT_232813 [Galerina marginata CBS 339.88]
MFWLIQVLWLTTLAVANGKSLKHVCVFGDSFSDQSRSHSISNGTYPGKDYQEVYPPADSAANGGFQWPFYLGIYGNYKIWNYAVGGTVCSNDITPVTTYPDVSNGQKAWFIQDHVVNGRLQLDPEEFKVIVWIGTNDIGIHSFISNDQPNNSSMADLADCQLNFVRSLHSIGARQFVLMSMIPLQLTRLYADNPLGTIYWPDVTDRNNTQWHKSAYNYPNTLNRLIRDGVSVLNAEFKGDGIVEYFNTYALFEEYYNNPNKYYNGSLPANVTGHCHQCPNPFDWHYCDIGDCTEDERDSFMWWDELHPSEQTGRNLAAEMNRKFDGKSKY